MQTNEIRKFTPNLREDLLEQIRKNKIIQREVAIAMGVDTPAVKSQLKKEGGGTIAKRIEVMLYFMEKGYRFDDIYMLDNH